MLRSVFEWGSHPFSLAWNERKAERRVSRKFGRVKIPTLSQTTRQGMGHPHYLSMHRVRGQECPRHTIFLDSRGGCRYVSWGRKK